MLVTRRKLMTAGSGGILFAGFAQGSAAQEQPAATTDILKSQFGFVGPEDDPDFGPLITNAPAANGAMAVGTGSSRHEEVATGFRILFDVKKDAGHMGAARYFRDVTKKNQNSELYNEEWKTRSNPVITGLFGMTNTLPSVGDQTAWCAAFVNFCLYAVGIQGTFSALSGSFRKFGTPVTENDVKEGDLVVFSKSGQAGNQGFGHVAFFLEFSNQNKSRVRLLGGNQRGGTGSTGAVTEAEFAVNGADLFVHSYRRIP